MSEEYSSQMTNKYYGVTDVGASSSNTGSQEAKMLADALKQFGASFDKAAISYVTDQKKTADADVKNLLLTKSPSELQKELEEGKHPSLQGLYAKNVVENNIGMYHGADTLAKIKEAEANYDFTTGNYQQFLEGVIDNEQFENKSEGYKKGFNAVVVPYVLSQESKYAELLGVYTKTERMRKQSNVLDTTTTADEFFNTLNNFQKTWIGPDGSKEISLTNKDSIDLLENYFTLGADNAISIAELDRLETLLVAQRPTKNGAKLPSLIDTNYKWVQETITKINARKINLATAQFTALKNQRAVNKLNIEIRYRELLGSNKPEDIVERARLLENYSIYYGSEAANKLINDTGFNAVDTVAKGDAALRTLKGQFGSLYLLEEYLDNNYPDLSNAAKENILKDFADNELTYKLVSDNPVYDEFLTGVEAEIAEGYSNSSSFRRQGETQINKFKTFALGEIRDFYRTFQNKGKAPNEKQIEEFLTKLRENSAIYYKGQTLPRVKITDADEEKASKTLDKWIQEQINPEVKPEVPETSAGKDDVTDANTPEAIIEAYTQNTSDDIVYDTTEKILEYLTNMPELTVEQITDNIVDTLSQELNVPLERMRDMLTKFLKGEKIE
jgi:hypothetical protein